jgi:hypothetical protein
MRSRFFSLSGHEKLDTFGGTKCKHPYDVGCASTCVGCGWHSVVVVVVVELEAEVSGE